MAPKRRSAGKAAAKGKAKAIANAAAKALAQREQNKISRRQQRREALAALNTLVEELQMATPPLSIKTLQPGDVERLVQKLEPRCQHGELPVRLRAATEQWHANGGVLSRTIVSAPDGTGPASAECLVRHKVLQGGYILKSRAFMLTFNKRAWTPSKWEEFLEWVRGLQPTLGFRAWAACLEVSTHAASSAHAGDVVHCHAYFYWTDGVGLFRRNTDDLVFDGVNPRVDVCTSTGRAFHMGACHGLWYVAVVKHGTLYADTNYKAWRDYSPKEKWLTDLWGEQKMTHAQFLDMSAQFRNGHAARRRDAAEVQMYEKRRAVRDHLRQESGLLQSAGLVKPRRAFSEIDAFVALFAAPALRRPIFAIVGGTNTGKSLLGAAILREVGETLGLTGFVELTVEADEQMDLSDYDVSQHAGVLLDGVGDAMFLHRHREALQGRAKECKEGKSATMMYAYPFTFCRRAVVVTFDLAAHNLNLLKEHHWLSDPRNVRQLWLTEPAWQGDAGAPVAQQDKRRVMHAWSVAELCDFLESNDLHGPAKHLRANGVRGRDMLTLDAAALVTDVGLTKFAASRVIACRDVFIG